jgi:hypothetical protein
VIIDKLFADMGERLYDLSYITAKKVLGEGRPPG